MRNKSVEKKFLQVYDEHSDAIFRFCYFKLLDKDKAEEMTQEAFMRTWEYLSNGKEVENIRAFIYRVAKNIIVDYFRKKKETSLDELHEMGFDASQDDASRWTDQLDGAQAIQTIHLLDAKYRDVLLLRYVNDLSVKEIANIIGQTENHISVLIHRGLKKVKELLKPKEV